MAPYVSHPVRRIRADPTDEPISLVVELAADADDSALTATVGSASGRVVRELPFDAYLLSVPQTAVDALCELPSVVRVETANTLSIHSHVAEPPEPDDSIVGE